MSKSVKEYKFSELIPFLGLKQFYQVADALGIRIVEKVEVEEKPEPIIPINGDSTVSDKLIDETITGSVEKDDLESADLAAAASENSDAVKKMVEKIKPRRDFEAITEEMISIYSSMDRRTRRKMDRLMRKITGRAATKQKYSDEERRTILERYNAGLESKAEIIDVIKADLAATASEGGNDTEKL